MVPRRQLSPPLGETIVTEVEGTGERTISGKTVVRADFISTDPTVLGENPGTVTVNA